MYPRTVLRFEGIAVFTAAVAAHLWLDGPLWLLVALAPAPDLSMLGYLAGTRPRSYLYNAFHTYVGPVTLGAVGVWVGASLPLWIALVWAAHIGADRAVGYGLKFPSGFDHTHLSPRDDGTKSDRLDVSLDVATDGGD